MPILAVVMLIGDAWLALIGVDLTRQIPSPWIRHDVGHAYVSRVPVNGPLRVPSDDNDHPRRSHAVVLENGVTLGPAHAMHATIRQIGGGQFSHWDGGIYFSTPDNTDPRDNGRTYQLRGVAYLEWHSAIALLLIGVGLLGVSRPAPLRRGITPVLKVLSRVAAAMVAVTLVLGLAEALVRWGRPFAAPQWPSIFDDRVGFRFEPGSIVRWTNNVDFWTETKVNSLGFLDREPPPSRPADGCRVLFIGDSFVEAAQVPIDKKFHVLFERSARERLQRSFQTVAFGYSGTGQANQLPFYEVFGKDLKPDVVVLVFAANDFANNSPVLEAVRNGWHPLRSPRVFFLQDRLTGDVRRIPITVNWQKYILPVVPVASPEEGRVRIMHTRLFSGSFLYRWAFTHISVQLPALAARVASPTNNVQSVAARRMAAIRQIPGFAQVFDGWRYPDDLDYDAMFFAKELPPIFAEAVELTGHIIDEYLGHARRDAFALAALATYRLHADFGGTRVMLGREIEEDGYYRRLAGLLQPRDVPLIDQHDYIVGGGGRVADAHFRRDGHWSERGHQWAAEALLEFFSKRPDLCRRARS